MKGQDASIRIVLADPTGSSLLHKVKFNVCYTPQQAERGIRKHRYDSVVEGVGLDRVTHNFALGAIDSGHLIPDQEVVDMAHWLLKNEGLFVGSSSALNVAGTVREAYALKQQQQQANNGADTGNKLRLVTVVCDNGNRHLSRFWNQTYLLKNYKLNCPENELPDCLSLFSCSNSNCTNENRCTTYYILTEFEANRRFTNQPAFPHTFHPVRTFNSRLSWKTLEMTCMIAWTQWGSPRRTR